MKKKNKALDEEGLGYGFLKFAGCNMLGAVFASVLVVYVAPPAAGSGIPDVKAWLNGSLVPNLFEMKAFFVKFFGIIGAVSGSFIVGKEGPMVHMGSALASGISLGRSKPLGFDIGIGYSFRNDADRRDLISCGAAAGMVSVWLYV